MTPAGGADAAPVSCPNCRQAMQAQKFERNDHGSVQVELCFTCAGIWFDHLASIQLAPGAVIELFKEIQANQRAARQPVANSLACPRCEDALALSYDLAKAGRFSYFRCPRGDGRFTPFFQFLREKQFIRNLTLAEIEKVKSQVRQINCAECGAPIDLEHETQCKYCHAPVSFLDPDAVHKAMQVWSAADARRRAGPTPEAVAESLLRIQLASQVPSGAENRGGVDRLDLVTLGIHAIGELFR